MTWTGDERRLAEDERTGAGGLGVRPGSGAASFRCTIGVRRTATNCPEMPRRPIKPLVSFLLVPSLLVPFLTAFSLSMGAAPVLASAHADAWPVPVKLKSSSGDASGKGRDPAREAGAAESLMKKSGLWQQFDGLAGNVQKAFAGTVDGRGPALSASEKARIDKVIAQAFEASRLRGTALRRLTSALEPSHVARLQAWYDGALGQRISAIEVASSRDTRDTATMVSEGEAAFAQLSPSRRALLERLVLVTRSGEAITNIVINTTLAVQMGFKQAMPDAPGPSLRDLREGLQLQRPQLVTAYERYATVVGALTYRTLGDADLTRYVDFLATPAGQHFTDLSLRAFDDALVEAAARFGRGLSSAKDKANT